MNSQSQLECAVHCMLISPMDEKKLPSRSKLILIDLESSKDIALLSLIVIVQQSSSFVFAWLRIVLRC